MNAIGPKQTRGATVSQGGGFVSEFLWKHMI